MTKSSTNCTATCTIIPYDPLYKQAFTDINLAWVRALFTVEPEDEKVLGDPEGTIINKGGEIFFALLDGGVVGTVALKSEGKGIFELSKLGVTPKAQKGGIGRALCAKVIERFSARNGTLLYLDTSSKLTGSIRLYEKLGFAHIKRPTPAPFARGDVYMEWRP